MAESAEASVRAWVNGPSGLTSGALNRGAYLKSQASPADGAYAVLQRQSTADNGVTAEPGPWQMARISAQVYAGTIEAAELAAQAYADAVRTLTGRRVAMGAATCLAHDNLSGPALVVQPAETGEQYCFQVVADFLLMEG